MKIKHAKKTRQEGRQQKLGNLVKCNWMTFRKKN